MATRQCNISHLTLRENMLQPLERVRDAIEQWKVIKKQVRTQKGGHTLQNNIFDPVHLPQQESVV